MEDDRTVFIEVNISTSNKAEAVRVAEILSRIIAGFAFDGLDATLSVSLESYFEDEEEIEAEEER